jgi:hypothetical protein
MSLPRLTRADVELLHFASLPAARARVIEDYCRTLDPTVDSGETPYGQRCTLAWVYHQNFELGRTEPLFGTICAFEIASGAFVGMGSIVHDDRGVRAAVDFRGRGVWGGVIVPLAARGRGAGTLIAAALHERCTAAAAAAAAGEALEFCLFTANPTAVRMYEGLGFARRRAVVVDGEDVALYSMVYTAGRD